MLITCRPPYNCGLKAFTHTEDNNIDAFYKFKSTEAFEKPLTSNFKRKSHTNCFTKNATRVSPAVYDRNLVALRNLVTSNHEHILLQ